MVILMGVLWLILGLCLLAEPLSAGIVSVVIVGTLMSLAAVVEVLQGFKVQQRPALRLAWVLVGLGTFLCGIFILKMAWADLTVKLVGLSK